MCPLRHQTTDGINAICCRIKHNRAKPMFESASAIFSIADAGEFRFARFYIVYEEVPLGTPESPLIVCGLSDTLRECSNVEETRNSMQTSPLAWPCAFPSLPVLSDYNHTDAPDTPSAPAPVPHLTADKALYCASSLLPAIAFPLLCVPVHLPSPLPCALSHHSRTDSNRRSCIIPEEGTQRNGCGAQASPASPWKSKTVQIPSSAS